MNEENSGTGGRAYTQDYKSDLREHVAAIEIDNGDGRPLGLNVSERLIDDHLCGDVREFTFLPSYDWDPQDILSQN